MKKQRIYKLIIVGMVTLLLTAGPVEAKSKRIKSEGCRVTPSLFDGDTTCPGGEPITNDGVMVYPFCTIEGRWHVRGAQNLWNIYGGEELVDGTAFLDLNLNCDGPPPAGLSEGHCRGWGSFELIPDVYCNDWGTPWGTPGTEAYICSDVSGSWVGTFENLYHDGIMELRIEAHGTGDLKGLKLKRYDVLPIGPPGSVCVTGGSIPFTWRISGFHKR